MSESVEQAAREVLAAARACGDLPLPLILALTNLDAALTDAADE